MIITKFIGLFKKNEKNDINIDSENLATKMKNYSSESLTVLKETQPTLPFSTNKNSKITSSNFRLPSINFLEKNYDQKNRKNNNSAELNKNSEFLEKILLDFGIEGKIKRISWKS